MDKVQSSYYAYIEATFETGYKTKLFLFRTDRIYSGRLVRAAELYRYINWKPIDARKVGHEVSVR